MKRTIALVVGLTVAFAGRAAAQQSLQQQNEQILQELKAIRQLLEKLAGPLNGAPPGAVPTTAPAPMPVSDNVKLANVTGYILGKADAPLTMVEFTDLQCPFCRQFHTQAFEQIKKEYIDTGKLRYISRDFPLESIHPFAIPAARAARCAGDQGKFWDMRHVILINNATLNHDAFATFAGDLKMNVNAFKTCTADAAKFQAEIQKDLTDGSSVGIQGTPSFVIGKTSANGLDGVRLVGAQPFSAFDAKLKDLLAK